MDERDRQSSPCAGSSVRRRGARPPMKVCAGPWRRWLPIARFDRHPKTADGRTHSCSRCLRDVRAADLARIDARIAEERAA